MKNKEKEIKIYLKRLINLILETAGKNIEFSLTIQQKIISLLITIYQTKKVK